MATIFRDRHDAGKRLAQELRFLAGRSDLLVLGLARGGIPVAYEVARALNAPLDVFVVRKLGVPGREESAMGAIATGGIRVLNPDVIRMLGIPANEVERITRAERRELERREQAYRGQRPAPNVTGRTVILVDDGLATGASMFAAVAALRQQAPAAVIVAVPVGAPDTCEALRRTADGCVCAQTPRPFHGVSEWYIDFRQTSDAEVSALLADTAAGQTPETQPTTREAGRAT